MLIVPTSTRGPNGGGNANGNSPDSLAARLSLLIARCTLLICRRTRLGARCPMLAARGSDIADDGRLTGGALLS